MVVKSGEEDRYRMKCGGKISTKRSVCYSEWEAGYNGFDIVTVTPVKVPVICTIWTSCNNYASRQNSKDGAKWALLKTATITIQQF